MTVLLDFDSDRDVAFAHEDERFARVMHVVHAAWHGIRSATACMPGHKMAIPHEGPLDGDFYRHAIGLVAAWRIEVVCFQGLSSNAFSLANVLRSEFGSALRILVITHVTSTQFENFFEIEMQHALLNALAKRVVDRAGSVKPGFDSVVPAYWPHTIYNSAPNIAAYRAGGYDPEAVFVPLENSWRKNLYTNVLGACAVPEVQTVFTVNRPTGLDMIADISKVRLCSYMRGMNLYTFMGAAACVLNATLAECQPMTELEALAMGTPCITGPLALEAFADHPFTELTEVRQLDTPAAIAACLQRILQERRRDEAGFRAMLDDYLALRNARSIDSYLAFFEG